MSRPPPTSLDDITTYAIDRVRLCAEGLRAGTVDESDPAPYYELVPKGFRANLRFREKMLELGAESKGWANAIKMMCGRDLLFYVNTYCWTYDTRDKKVPVRPFITWKYQDRALLDIAAAMGDYDLLIEKSRDMGATWLIITAFEWDWHFHSHSDLLLVSRTADYVEKAGNKKTLFYKVDFLHAHQPEWLLPTGRHLGENDPNRNAMHRGNADTKSSLDGESTTGELASGDRRQAIMIDELSKFKVQDGYNAVTATRDVSPCRVFNFTPRGRGNAAYELTKTPIKRLRMHWSEHPLKRQGLYRRTEEGALEIVDTVYWSAVLDEKGLEYDPDNIAQTCQEGEVYEFVLDDVELPLRSPWFDKECLRCRSRAEIFQELEIRYDAASSPFFNSGDLEKHRATYCEPPLHRGELDWVPDTLQPDEFQDLPNGPMSLWFRVGGDGKPPADQDYVAGADIATGTRGRDGRGSSNSVLSIFGRQTCEMVAQYVVSGMGAETFAERCIAICRWFRGPGGNEPRLIWENNGPGGAFGNRVVEVGYSNIYLGENVTALGRKVTKVPGWASTVKSKTLLLSELRRGLRRGLLVVRSAETLEECEQYQYGPGGLIVHAESLATDDLSEARDQHGDRVISVGLCWWELRDTIQKAPQTPRAPTGSFGQRQRDWRKKQREAALW